jgi:proteic killer suppression protein
MIRSFAHRGLERFFRTGSLAKIQPAHAKRLQLILGVLNSAVKPQDAGLPGLGLHRLTGQRAGFWALTVSGNWRVVFRFHERDAYDVDYVDYH